MSKRLQVLLGDAEFADIRRAARLNRMTVAEWVRQALRRARREEPTTDPRRKLAAVREGARASYPSPDIDQMLAEIERVQEAVFHRNAVVLRAAFAEDREGLAEVAVDQCDPRMAKLDQQLRRVEPQPTFRGLAPFGAKTNTSAGPATGNETEKKGLRINPRYVWKAGHFDAVDFGGPIVTEQ
jgi:hypothetical protein